MPDYENETLLITCASGRQSTELIPHVMNKWKHVRLQCKSSESAARLSKTYPSAEVVQTDMADPSACRNLLQNISCVFLVDPPFHPHEATLGINMVDACLANRSAGGPFTHLIYSSVIFPILRKMLNHDCKRYVEEYIVESGLSYTILEPTHLMETMPLAKLMSEQNPVYPANWNPQTKFTFVSCKDVGEAAAKVLQEREKHFYATYQLVGTATPINYVEVLAFVSDAIGKQVQIQQRSFEEAVNVGIKILLGGRDVPDATKQIGKRMFLYYNDRGLVGNRNVLQWVLGHKPLDYKEWVEAKVKELRSQQ